MPATFTNSLAPIQQTAATSRSWPWYIAMVGVLLLTQAGALAPDVIDWDESTFILMGADVARGNLPYVGMFDIKPPMMFLLLGGVMALFGKSLVAIRLFGDLCLLTACAGTFVLARRHTGTTAAGIASLMVIAMASDDYGLHTGTELPASAAMMWAMVLTLLKPNSLLAAAGSGLLVSLAILTRSNLAPVAIVLGLWYLFAPFVATSGVRRVAVWAYAAAGLAPVVIIIAVYAAAGQIDVLRVSVIDVSIAYATGQLSMVDALLSHIDQYVVSVSIRPLVYVPFTLLALAGGVLAVLAALRAWRRRSAAPAFESLTLIMLGTVLFSVLAGGAAYAHYWLQLLPLLGLLVAMALAALIRAGRWQAIGASAMCLTAVGSALTLMAPTSLRTLSDFDAAITDQRPVLAISRDIRSASPDAAPQVWALHGHLVHWYLDAPLLSPVLTHPDNIVRRPIIDTLAANGIVPYDALNRIWTLKPRFIVLDSNRSLLYLTDNRYPIDRYLATHYRELSRHGSIVAYVRRDASGRAGASDDIAAPQPRSDL